MCIGRFYAEEKIPLYICIICITTFKKIKMKIVSCLEGGRGSPGLLFLPSQAEREGKLHEASLTIIIERHGWNDGGGQIRKVYIYIYIFILSFLTFFIFPFFHLYVIAASLADFDQWLSICITTETRIRMFSRERWKTKTFHERCIDRCRCGRSISYIQELIIKYIDLKRLNPRNQHGWIRVASDKQDQRQLST